MHKLNFNFFFRRSAECLKLISIFEPSASTDLFTEWMETLKFA